MKFRPSWLMDALFLDAAGTLFDLVEPVGQTYSRMASRHGLELDPDTAETAFVDAFLRLPPPDYTRFENGHEAEKDWWRKLVQQTSGSDDDRFFQELFDHYESSSAWQLVPDTLPFLERSQAHFRLAVVSNFDNRLHPILKQLGIDHFFETVVTSADSQSRKPEGKIFELAYNRLNLEPPSILHIGDSKQADYEGARRAGLRAHHLRRPGETLLDVLSS